MTKLLLVLSIFFFSTYITFSQDTSLISSRLYQSPIFKDHIFGFSLYDMDQHQFLLGTNEDKYFTPASNTKIFTLFTALKNLEDSIPALHYIEKGDSLLFWGTGDPTFLHPKLDTRKVYNFLAETDKKLFYVGDLTADEPFYRMGWAMEDYDEYYQPEITAFPIYGNVATFRSVGHKLRVSPARFQVDIASDGVATDRFWIRRDWNDNTFLINNTNIPNSYITQKPFKYSDKLFVQLLQDTLHKQVNFISYPKPIKVDTLYSAVTRDVLREMMLTSDNFLAEQLMMVVALNRYHAFLTARLRKDMATFYPAYLMDKIDLYDGSGLSPYNKVTPRALVDLLLMIAREVNDVDELHYLFAAGGLEGTLRNTYQLDGGMPFVWAKTGTLKGVYCQSGYIQARSGRNLAFSFLHNNFIGSPMPVRQEVSRIITFIRKNF
ncbi:D-alanyl-D-alanine carboxypeptidase/D-alanyl-D-alanine-endopeptidase [Sphingobacterium arenae]|uniref:D-alanyl-D-alanine carboxypeptidase n=1 Tax=Sphingobacterium arenae TaxID=1280598 RepID=A0ABR7Y202_9SPHI|nr:D-alanyl-D-alanine carboxypeptidase [Sphingobacterium arenae]MBD1425308.1 D-alanyl-D-alanine carboxypeptidase [Sphingobacterium arenae]